jgi:hypothetical protein
MVLTVACFERDTIPTTEDPITTATAALYIGESWVVRRGRRGAAGEKKKGREPLR